MLDASDILDFYTRYHHPDIIDLSSSSPPSHPVPAAQSSSSEDMGYVPPTGADDLRAAIASRYEALGPDDIVLSAGASESLVALAHALIGAGDLVVIERGVYPSFLEAAERVGAECIRSGEGTVPGAEVVHALCNPSVPAGQLRDLSAFADWPGVLVSDEVHLDLVHSGERPRRAADIEPHFVSVSGLSKSLGLPGLRIGWVATRDQYLRDHLDRELQLLSGGPAGPSVAYALAAMESCDEYIAGLSREVAAHAPELYAALERLGWRFSPAQAGLTVEAYPPSPPPPGAEERVLEAGFFLVPSRLYGDSQGYRIALLAPVVELERALALLTNGH